MTRQAGHLTVARSAAGGIADAKQKTDRQDAKTLAQMLAAGMLEHSWLPDEDTRATRRRTTRRANLVVARARCKNEVLTVLHRNLRIARR